MDIFRILVFENVFFQGEGCVLIGRFNKFEQIIRGMNFVLDVSFIVKMRTGIFDNKNIVYIVIFKFRDWGVFMVIVSIIQYFYDLGLNLNFGKIQYVVFFRNIMLKIFFVVFCFFVYFLGCMFFVFSFYYNFYVIYVYYEV